MKNDNWLIYLIVAFTSVTTFGLVSDGSMLGVLRGIGAAVILDGLVIYWEGKRITCKDESQRTKAEYMMWGGVAIVLLFSAGYAIEYAIPSDTVNNLNIFNYSVAVKLSELIVFVAWLFIGAWVVLTLAVVLYLRGIDPETKKDIERTKAAEERERQELDAYKIANKHTARELGVLKAMELYRKDLEAIGKYTAGEIDRMIVDAREEIDRQQIMPPPAIPADSVGLKIFNSDTATNPTKPSTHPK